MFSDMNMIVIFTFHYLSTIARALARLYHHRHKLTGLITRSATKLMRQSLPPRTL